MHVPTSHPWCLLPNPAPQLLTWRHPAQSLCSLCTGKDLLPTHLLPGFMGPDGAPVNGLKGLSGIKVKEEDMDDTKASRRVRGAFAMPSRGSTMYGGGQWVRRGVEAQV